jgi:hypothetical protein
MTLTLAVNGTPRIVWTWTGGIQAAGAPTGLPLSVGPGDVVTLTLATSTGAADLTYYVTGRLEDN